MAEGMAEEFHGKIPGRGAGTAREQPLSRVRITVTFFFSHEQWQPRNVFALGAKSAASTCMMTGKSLLSPTRTGTGKVTPCAAMRATLFHALFAWGVFSAYVSSMLFFGSPPLHAGMSSRDEQ